MNAQGSTNSTVLVDGLAIYQRQNAADIPINAVAFSGADIGSSVFISGTNTLLNLDADNSVLTQWDAEGDWYGNNTNLTLSIIDNLLKVGTWQGIYLFEHRTEKHVRSIFCHVIGEI